MRTMRDRMSAFYRTIALAQVRRRSQRPGATPRECYRYVHDSVWFWSLSEGIQQYDWLAELLPGFPDQDVQASYSGASGLPAMKDGFLAYRLFKRIYQQHAGPLSAAWGILDFGCGWGRIIRFFLKDVPPERLYGVDHSERALTACRATNRWCRFQLIEPDPPTQFEDESFDCIYLYSVFSHLPEDLHWSLLGEFQRLLRPGGLLIATTRRRDFIQRCEELRHDPRLDQMPSWKASSARAFPDTSRCLEAYDAGEFCYSSLGQSGRWSFWGEACISRAYVVKRWTERFEFIEYLDDERLCPQNVIVVRKRNSANRALLPGEGPS